MWIMCLQAVLNKYSGYYLRTVTGTWGAQPIKCPTLDLSSGLDLRAVSSSPALGSPCWVWSLLKKGEKGGAWVAQSVKRPTSAQVTISHSVSSSPASGSVLTAQSLEPVSDSVSPSLSAPPHLLAHSLSQNKQTNKQTNTQTNKQLFH